MRKRALIALAVMAAIAVVAATAFAAPAVSTNPDLNPDLHPNLAGPGSAAATSTTTGSTPATYTPPPASITGTGTVGGTYDLSWTLPTAGKSGCLVCHGDKNLVRIRDGRLVSLFVDYQNLQNSAHANVQCTGCHSDFAYKVPHPDTKTDEWKNVAKSSCNNCHKSEFAAYTSGAHSPARPPGVKLSGSSAKGKPLPQCGDCHGGHDIPNTKDNPEAQRTFHASALEMCGQCHVAESTNYADYYHGAAYKEGAPDAPACWDCHKAHDVLPSSDRRSPTNPDNLPQTCGQCHKGDPDDQYASYAKLIHGKASVLSENPLYGLYQSVTQGIEGAWNAITGVFSGK